MQPQTTFLQPAQIQRSWYQVSAKGQVLGRLAARIAVALMGRNRPDWTPHVDAGHFVIVTDAEQVAVTGNKERTHIYRFHSGYFGGLKLVPLGKLKEKHPERVIELAVKRMLPKTVQGRHMLKRLKVYRGAAHPHSGVKPLPLP
ncbi:MAG: 50S ribosomal protein L13 [Planctomycetota bacterium]|nr:50S ribosomal protein L13 [Planctomycetota bacterium]MCX8039972.1 50S ribosomal protein L13 [Planctomycetota bacterium]MDW8372960.1 50S ribosomal protein L13 [Planctomycetota bacterium]